MMKFLIRILAAFFPAVVSAQAASLTLSAEDIRGPLSNVKGIQITLAGTPPASSLGMKLTEVTIQGKTWHTLHFSCDRFHTAREDIRCMVALRRMRSPEQRLWHLVWLFTGG